MVIQQIEAIRGGMKALFHDDKGRLDRIEDVWLVALVGLPLKLATAQGQMMEQRGYPYLPVGGAFHVGPQCVGYAGMLPTDRVAEEGEDLCRRSWEAREKAKKEQEKASKPKLEVPAGAEVH